MRDIKLDKWIAAKVMGYEVRKVQGGAGWYCRRGEYDNPNLDCIILPMYTYDLSRAFEAMWKAGCTGLGIGPSPDFKMFCATVELDWEKQEKAFAEKPAKAICMAIYKLITGKDWTNEASS